MGKRSSQHRLASPRHRERDNRERRRMEDYRRESKEKYRSSRDDRYKEKYSERDRRERNREDRSRRRSNSRERRRSNSRERRRSNSRERRRSNSRERRRSNSRERRRSNSRERRSRSPSRRNDYRNNKKSDRKYEKFAPKVNLPIEKPQIELQKPEITQPDKKFETEKDRFFMPGITGRFRDQIERRKLLWQKKEDPVKPTPASSTSTKVWQTTTFAQDTDGKVASKFKRLMGIKEQSEQAKQATDVLKRQEEMFSSMEQQYEVARTATHTMRGVGLGFGSYQR